MHCILILFLSDAMADKKIIPLLLFCCFITSTREWREHLIVLLVEVAAQSNETRAAWKRRKKCEVAAVVWSLSCSRAISRARSLASLLASARFCFTLLSSAVGRPVNLLDELFRPNKINLLSTKCEGGRETSRCRPSAPHDACSIAFYHRRRFDLRFTICLLCFMPL